MVTEYFPDPHETTKLHIPYSTFGQVYVDIDCNIAELVALFWSKGIVTHFSCEGHDHDPTDFSTANENDQTLGYLVMDRTPRSMAFLHYFLDEFPVLKAGKSTYFRIDFLDLTYNPRVISIRFKKVMIPELTEFLMTFK